MRREIFIGEPRISKYERQAIQGERQDNEIIAAAELWRDGFVSAEELIEDAICRVYRSNGHEGDEAGVDVCGSVDVWTRLNDDGIVSDCMYDRVLTAIAEAQKP